MPTPESNAIFSKIAEGKLKLQDVKGPDGKIRYQPPKVTSSSSSTTRGMTTQGIRIKGGVAMPVHMKPEAHMCSAGSPMAHAT
jgi:YidC/Oxa1 family membrane protein insertase